MKTERLEGEEGSKQEGEESGGNRQVIHCMEVQHPKDFHGFNI